MLKPSFPYLSVAAVRVDFFFSFLFHFYFWPFSPSCCVRRERETVKVIIVQVMQMSPPLWPCPAPICKSRERIVALTRLMAAKNQTKTNKQTKTIRRWNGKAKEKKKNRHVPVVWRLYSFLYFFFNSTFLVGFQYKINLQRVVFLRVFLYRRFFAGRHRIFLFVFSFLFFWRVGRREGAICMSFA